MSGPFGDGAVCAEDEAARALPLPSRRKRDRTGGILGSGGREGKNLLLRSLVIWVKEGPAAQDHPAICSPQISILPRSPAPSTAAAAAHTAATEQVPPGRV